ncbi:MAG: VOC family protein [Steroidobacteraceae bacterium]
MSEAGLSLGRFHEISVSTENLADSLQFYELMGFVENRVEPIWPHPYAVVSLGRLVVGLHEYRFPSPSMTCVHDDIGAALGAYQEAGAIIAFAKTEPGCFKEFGFRDPAGHMVTLLERSTHLGNAIDPSGISRTLGRFAGFSLPSAAPEISTGFWQALGARPLVGQPIDSRIWPVTMLDAAGLIIGIHDESWLEKPALVFHRPGVSERTVFESPEGARLIVIG